MCFVAALLLASERAAAFAPMAPGVLRRCDNRALSPWTCSARGDNPADPSPTIKAAQKIALSFVLASSLALPLGLPALPSHAAPSANVNDVEKFKVMKVYQTVQACSRTHRLC